MTCEGFVKTAFGNLTVELGLGFDAQHPERRRNVEIPWYPHMTEVDIEGDTPDGQPV